MKKNIIITIFVVSLLFLITGCDSKKTITFETNDKNVVVKSIKAEPGSKISSPSNVVREGYRLDGWNLDGQLFVFDVMPDNDITLTANWTKLYYITFDYGDKTEIQGYGSNEKILYPTVELTNGMLFSHWELEGRTYNEKNMPSQNIKLTAVWKEAVTVYFDTGIPGEIVEPLIGAPGDPVIYPQMPEIEGYRFAGWSLDYEQFVFHQMPEHDIMLKAIWEKAEYTNFPALYIDLFDSNWDSLELDSVGKENYENAIFSLENTTTGNVSKTTGVFRGRGNGSWRSPKKGYRIKFDEKQSPFGEAESRHWVIIACFSNDFTDTTMMRNALAYQIGGEYFDEIPYTTSANWVDVYINGAYYGTYLFAEQIREANDRVNIDSEYGVNDTGYLIEYDAYSADDGAIQGVDYFNISGVKYGFTVKSPATDEYLENGVTQAQFREQISWLQRQVQAMYNAALSRNFEEFSKYANVDSFVDMYILHELFKNTDAGWSSFYISKTAGGKFEANAPWDFDASAGISRGDSSPTGIYVAGNIQQASNNTSSELFIALYKTSEFRSLVNKRWIELSPSISQYLIQNFDYEGLSSMKEGMGRNYAKWCGNYSQVTAQNKWLQDAQTLISWLETRIEWLNSEWV